MESYLRILESLDEEIKLLPKELEGMAEDDEEVKLLMTIPGIGYYTAVLMKSESGDISRFPFPERLCSYAGLVPSKHASGKVYFIACQYDVKLQADSRVRWDVVLLGTEP